MLNRASQLSVAAVQMTSGEDVQQNLEMALSWVERAADAGAELIGLPENFGFIGPQNQLAQHAAPLVEHAFLNPLREWSAKFHVGIVAGGLPEKSADTIYQTCVVIDAEGDVAGVYRKRHLFDIDLADFTHRESDVLSPGNDVVLVSFNDWKLGLSVCYDLRFPEHFRQLSLMGADVMFVPSAFTLQTGKDHWEVLLRARAIENQSFVVAPAQFGTHCPGRVSWGKTMIVDPWGASLATVGEWPGLAVGQLYREHLVQVRRQLPVLEHRRDN